MFACLNESCGFESCRKCREASHIPLRCEEVEKKHESEGRHRVEEAASAAVIRFCPKCKKGILKTDVCVFGCVLLLLLLLELTENFLLIVGLQQSKYSLVDVFITSFSSWK